MLEQAAVIALAQQCAPYVAPHSMGTLVQAESSGNPYEIGVVGMQLVKKPQSQEEAVSTAKSLMAQGARISAGLGQIYMGNWEVLGLTVETVFDPCTNLKASAQVLGDCYSRASEAFGEGQTALQAAFSCYYSNNFSRGFMKESPTQSSYVMHIAKNSEKLKGVPEIQFKPSDIKEAPPKENATSDTKPVQALETIQQETKKEEKPEEAEKPAGKLSWDVLGDFN